jgi:hypothetical protein
LVRFSRRLLAPIIIIITSVFLLGCSGNSTILSPTPTLTTTQTNTPTPTKPPTPTFTPLPPVGILLAPPDTPAQFSAEIQSLLSKWIPEIGYRFQVRPSLSEADFERDDFRLVVGLYPNPEIKTMVENHPEVQFLTVGIIDLEPAANLVTIGADGERLDHQGFIAGYMAAMITPDWRVGVIGYSESETTVSARQAFFTGVAFFCGLCLPSYPPWYEYPLYFELGDDADTIAWRTAADFMIHRSVETVYVVPGAGDDAMLRHLADSGVNIIAGRQPLPDIQAHWVASLRFDLMETFTESWTDFTAGIGSDTVSIPLQITDINPDLFSPGKQRLIDVILTDLLDGYYDMGVVSSNEP